MINMSNPLSIEVSEFSETKEKTANQNR